MTVPVHPQIQVILDKMVELNVPAFSTLTPEQGRALMEMMVKARPQEPAPIASFEARTIPSPAGEIPVNIYTCLLYTSPSPRDMRRSRMPSSA